LEPFVNGDRQAAGVDARPADPTSSSDRGHGRETAAAYLAVFADAPSARQAEQLLGGLCANGLVDVLDGTLIHRSTANRLSWRPLENLPRLAALPEPVWAALTKQLAGDCADHCPHLLPLTATWPPGGGSAILVFCTNPSTDLAHELRSAGTSVTDTPVEADYYTALRHGDLPGRLVELNGLDAAKRGRRL
jgi:hypothetical protein